MLILTETQVGDAGLAHLETLAKLKTLTLGRIMVTYTGQLARLNGPSGFETESLSGTKVTDAGLVHLKNKSELRSLYLVGTRVSDAGIRSLQQKLPMVEIEH